MEKRKCRQDQIVGAPSGRGLTGGPEEGPNQQEKQEPPIPAKRTKRAPGHPPVRNPGGRHELAERLPDQNLCAKLGLTRRHYTAVR